MGGHGSGRKSKETELVDNLSVQKQNAISEDMFLPNHSGVASSPEMIGDSGFVKKTGDTMTGTLNGTDVIMTGDVTATDLNISRDNGELTWTGVNNTNINTFRAGDGTDARMDFNLVPADNSSNVEINFFRETNTSGLRNFTINKGDGTGTVMFKVDANTGNITAGDGTGDLTVAGSSEANLLFTKSDDNRVGIGTNTPAELLDVDGNMCISGNLKGTTATMSGDLRVNASLGINTAPTAYNLQVTGDAFFTEALTCTKIHGGIFSNADLTLVSTEAVTKGHIYFGDATTSHFEEATEKLTIGGTIVTTAQSNRLADFTINNGSIISAGANFSIGGNNLVTTMNVQCNTVTANTSLTVASNMVIGDGTITDTSGAISFGDENLSTTGTLGVGIASPTAVVQVGSTDAILINPTGTAQLSTLSGNAGGLRSSSGVLTMDSAAAMSIDYNTRGLTGTRDFTIRHDNSAMLTIEGGDNIGNVGIGTATPSTKLEVAGSGLFTGGLITLGVEDSVQGRLVLHGTATGEGGEINLKLPGDSDGTFQHWVIDVPAGDDLRIFTSDAAVIHTFSNSGTVTFNGNITGTKTSSDVVITGETTNADARLVLNNTGNGRHSGIQLVRERLSGTGMTAASIFVNSDTSTNNTQLIIQCNSSTNIGSLGPTDQRIVLDSATDTMDIDNCGVRIQEIASAKADKAGYGQIWVKNTTPCELWFTDDAGTDTQIV